MVLMTELNKFVTFYVDLIFGYHTFKEHMRQLDMLFTCSRNVGLTVNHKMIPFVTFQRHFVSREGKSPIHDRLERIDEFTSLENIK